MDSDELPLAPAGSPASPAATILSPPVATVITSQATTAILSPTATATPSTSGATSEAAEDGKMKTFEADRIFVLMQKDYRYQEFFFEIVPANFDLQIWVELNCLIMVKLFSQNCSK